MSDLAPRRRQEEALRFALAINRGIQLMDPQTKKGAMLVGHFAGIHAVSRDNANASAETVYKFIHSELFKDWQGQEQLHPPGKVLNPQHSGKLKIALNELLRGKAGLLMEGGDVRSREPEKVAESLARFYQKAAALEPFTYGNHLALEFFLTALMSQDRFKAVEPYDGGFDFRRLTLKEQAALRNPETSLEALTEIFCHTLDKGISTALKNKRDEFPKWPRNQTSIEGMNFVSHKKEDGSRYIVTVTGGLVPLKVATRLVKEHLAKGAHIADLMIGKEEVVGCLEGMEENLKTEKTHIDGITLGKNGAAPLCCLDMNILTGLRGTDHNWVAEKCKEIARKESEQKNEVPVREGSIFDLANNETLYRQLRKKAGKDDKLLRAVDIAYSGISAVVNKMNAAKAEALEGKTTETPPKFYMSMGGTSSGKTYAETLAEAECGKNGETPNYVKASLDELREKSDLYHVLRAAKDHADDYKIVEPLANNLRDWVANGAMEKGYNLLYDGTGINYEGRYGNTVRDFKKAGYETRLVGMERALENAMKRATLRFYEKNRAVPWNVFKNKHIDFPIALMQAAEDSNLDKISLYCNDKGSQGRYLMAESFILNEAEVEALAAARQADRLATVMQERMWSEDKSQLAILPMIKRGGVESEADLAIRTPKLEENNVAYFVYPGSNGQSRVFTIYDVERFTELVQKGQKNRDSSTLRGLTQLPDGAKFVVRR